MYCCSPIYCEAPNRPQPNVMQSLGIEQIFVCSKQDQTGHTTWVILLQRQNFSQQLFTRLRKRRLRALRPASRPGSLPDIYPPSRTKVVPRKSAQSNTGKSVLVVRTWTHKFETDLFESILSSLGGSWAHQNLLEAHGSWRHQDKRGFSLYSWRISDPDSGVITHHMKSHVSLL